MYCADRDRCVSQEGQLGSFTESNIVRLTDALFPQSAQIESVLVGAYRSDDGRWRWSQNDQLIDEQLWADGHPTDDAICAGLSGDGLLRGRTDCEVGVLCDQSGRPGCD